MQVQPIDLNTMEIDGRIIPLKEPNCLKCAHFAVRCPIYMGTSAVMAGIYPGKEGRPDAKTAAFAPETIAKICRYYAPLVAKERDSLTK